MDSESEGGEPSVAASQVTDQAVKQRSEVMLVQTRKKGLICRGVCVCVCVIVDCQHVMQFNFNL